AARHTSRSRAPPERHTGSALCGPESLQAQAEAPARRGYGPGHRRSIRMACGLAWGRTSAVHLIYVLFTAENTCSATNGSAGNAVRMTPQARLPGRPVPTACG